jgi:hypothetical protein
MQARNATDGVLLNASQYREIAWALLACQKRELGLLVAPIALLLSPPSTPISTSTPIPLTIQININRILKSPAILLLLLHRQRIPRHHFKRLLHIRVVLGTDLEIRNPAPTLTVRHRALRADGALVVSDVDLVAQDDKGEGLGVPR